MTENKIDIKDNGPPVGYNPIAEIRRAMFHEIVVPFAGMPIWCLLTCLNYVQLRSCGDISCLYFPKKGKEEKEPDILEIIERKNAQEAVCKLSMIRPSYDEVIGIITETDFRISEKQKALEKINEQIKSMPASSEKRKLEKMAEQIEYQIGFLLPDDAMSFITSWALGIEITDIKKLSRDILLDASIMASNGHDNPTDHITGVFTDFQREDINKHAWFIYGEYVEDKKREERLKKNGYQWSKKK